MYKPVVVAHPTFYTSFAPPFPPPAFSTGRCCDRAAGPPRLVSLSTAKPGRGGWARPASPGRRSQRKIAPGHRPSRSRRGSRLACSPTLCLASRSVSAALLFVGCRSQMHLVGAWACCRAETNIQSPCLSLLFPFPLSESGSDSRDRAGAGAVREHAVFRRRVQRRRPTGGWRAAGPHSFPLHRRPPVD